MILIDGVDPMNQCTEYDNCSKDLVATHAPIMSCIVQVIAQYVLPDFAESERIGVALFCLVVAASRVKAHGDSVCADIDASKAWSDLIDELSDQGVLPRLARDSCRQLGTKVISLENRLGRGLLAHELADALGVSTGQYHALQREVNALLVFGRNDLSPEGDGVDGLLELIAGEGWSVAQSQSARCRLIDSLARTIDGLPELEMFVVNLFYNEELTLAEIGDLLGLEEQQISKLHSQAIVRLRSQFRQHC